MRKLGHGRQADGGQSRLELPCSTASKLARRSDRRALRAFERIPRAGVVLRFRHRRDTAVGLLEVATTRRLSGDRRREVLRAWEVPLDRASFQGQHTTLKGICEKLMRSGSRLTCPWVGRLRASLSGLRWARGGTVGVVGSDPRSREGSGRRRNNLGIRAGKELTLTTVLPLHPVVLSGWPSHHLQDLAGAASRADFG